MSQLVEIAVERLLRGDDVSADIETAFGRSGLGALTVSGVPGYAEARRRCLQLAPRLAGLPGPCLRQYEDPESSYSFGWSHGKEALQDGKADRFKGSFYANPLVDRPCSEEALVRRFPAYFRPNIWPARELPELEPAFKELGQLIVKVGLLLMEQCDRYAASVNPGAAPGRLRGVLNGSRNHKARLLHYFPADGSSSPDDVAAAQDQEWCGWHTDHGSLTGLASAMYMKDGQEVENPDTDSGLYIRDRSGDIVKARIPGDHIAFQVGEALQVHSGGLLKATPHYVKAANGSKAAGVSRNTLAVFMQPDVMEPLDCPAGRQHQDAAVGQWQPGMNYGEFSDATFKRYYGPAAGGGV